MVNKKEKKKETNGQHKYVETPLNE